MDEPEDTEIKIQRASGELINDLTATLPALLWKPSREGASQRRIPRRWVLAGKTDKLLALLEPFQEWPQLLDPHLQKLLPPLVDAFLAYLVQHQGQYAARSTHSGTRGQLLPLPRAVCRLLYTFCKVRGVKVISRFLNNEPKYLDPLLRAFIEWNSVVPAEDSLPDALVWEERYIMLVWLSHLLLAPFDLVSISSSDIPIPFAIPDQLGTLPAETPVVTESLLAVALQYIGVSGKEREAASLLLARLSLRKDMKALGFLNRLTDWAFRTIQPRQQQGAEVPSVYMSIGVLSYLARLGASGQVEDFAPLVIPVFRQTIRLAQEKSEAYEVIQSSAIARKMVIKILRTVTVMALSLNEKGDESVSDEGVSSILEETIDYLLTCLADKDTPVRFAASKALSVITLKLDPDMAAEVIEAVIGSLEENILYQKPDGTLITAFEARKIGLTSLKRNLSAVDAQRWQGLMLTLAHLLFRRAPPPRQLPDVLQSLLSGLDFEQRLTTGNSVGTGVRDASCFGVWALSRKYTTKELLALDARSIHAPTDQEKTSVLQILAVELVCAACVDPSGNIRRGSSAALQELIGRHPDTVVEGIPLVQAVDYHAVARRSRAMIEVAKATASLSDVYWAPLVESLLQWRGIGSPDADSRRYAAKALGVLSTHRSFKTLEIVLKKLLQKISFIPRNDVESRHGCLLAMAATVDAFNTERQNTGITPDILEVAAVSSQVSELWTIFSAPYGPRTEELTLQTTRPELTAEATSRLISSLSQSVHMRGGDAALGPSAVSLERALEFISFSLSRSEAIAIEASSEAASQLFPHLSTIKQNQIIQGWIKQIHSSWKQPSGHGQISALAAVYRKLEAENPFKNTIISELLRCTGKEELIEKRVAAVKCLSTDVVPYTDITDELADSFIDLLNDYTTDRRGDIGSLVRIAALSGTSLILQKDTKSIARTLRVQHIVGCLCRLAAEKLDKVRLQAWLCLQTYWESATDFPPLERRDDHFSHVSTKEYFLQLLSLQRIDQFRSPLLQGFATSTVAGTESVIRESRSALISFINGHDELQRQTLVITFINELVVVLSDNLQDDRYAIPTMELLAFLIDSYVDEVPEDWKISFRKLFVLVQKAHFKSSNMPRLEAAVRMYAPLSRMGSLRGDVLKKLTSMLLHPFPRVRNLDERIKIEELKDALTEIFSEYGTIVEIVAKTNLKAKGQAFIVFDDVDSATRAIDEVNGFELFDKPMSLDYAKTRSDATVLKEAGAEELEAHKRRRLAEKERKQAQEALDAQKKLKRPAGPTEAARPSKTTKGAGLKPTTGAAAAVIPDEYLPPNKILFLRDLPDSADQDSLSAVFGRFEGFREVRLVPGRKGIAFVEYENESGAISAKEATSGMPMGDQGKPIRVTYQRQ
ncbi:hypothetical protein ASPZODRAFT_155944 [Penicilliopsis zonata CBS 506.65]|uniref:RRM domain-containing protein n=1 Tax=Penicilliopsis zonata CBS 506.65 TaxID=1073090 RepID=A0A1L9SUR3_9EURO|nr:hypothetical protein ASPZODRAFT_155944 [Penicilliopsis zonata CBS 506.65]OJJ50938.1 hypothetical protein ASPZODRAFT_155944 [Penicilliopsis zonata CBS 506.65]